MKSLASFLILTLVVSLLAACSPSGLPTPEPAASSLPPPIPKVTPTKEVLISFGAPSVSATLYGDAGNYALQAGVPAQVTWRDAPPAAESYAFTLKLHSDKSLRLIGTDTDETNGIGVEWLIPAFISGELKASAYFADGREVHSSAIDVYSYEAVPPGACVLRSQTIVPITVYKEPSDTAEIIGVMYPNSMLETIGKDTNGWYKVKTDEVYTTGSLDQKLGPGTAWVYESITELFGTCEHLPVLEAIVHTSTTCTDPALGISYHVPAGWDIRLNQPGDFSTSLASSDLSNPPHKLEWNESSVQIDLKQLDPAPSSVENWVETAKEAYHVDGVSLWIYEQETRILETSCTLERLTLVSGSGGMLHLIYLSAG